MHVPRSGCYAVDPSVWYTEPYHWYAVQFANYCIFNSWYAGTAGTPISGTLSRSCWYASVCPAMALATVGCVRRAMVTLVGVSPSLRDQDKPCIPMNTDNRLFSITFSDTRVRKTFLENLFISIHRYARLSMLSSGKCSPLIQAALWLLCENGNSNWKYLALRRSVTVACPSCFILAANHFAEPNSSSFSIAQFLNAAYI
jgi:hypothetical protein